MKALYVLGLLVSLSAFSADKTYTVKTAQGASVQVYAQDLTAAYQVMISDGTNQIFKNEDGSITIVNPQIAVAGQSAVPVDFTPDTDTGWGVCQLKGLGNYISAQTGTITSGPIVFLDAQGKIDSFTNAQAYAGNMTLVAYVSVICSGPATASTRGTRN